ncbi:RusA family crossover junction endodeoxyribonuclease [Lacticaseibacillus saniviri]|uniref:RusA family crossover junction endodeoxyribonuclease n=1 Tax=Lacticaseibacillus saniviri TaxID=931533 RepID=UPI0006D0D82B|nr:RusA family crossover junction endodeoxyribonuclease [Lacticaseibacillus saniviri]
MTIKIIVPGEPVAQARPRVYRTKNGVRGVDPTKSRNYKAFVAQCAQQAYDDAPLEGPIDFRLMIYRPIQKAGSKLLKADKANGKVLPTVKPDLDNVYKAVSDALTGIVYVDDNQITDLIVIKRYSDNPRVEVEVKEIGMDR